MMVIIFGAIAIFIGVAWLVSRSRSMLQKSIASTCILAGTALLIVFPPSREELDAQRQRDISLCRRVAMKIDVWRTYRSTLAPLEQDPEWRGLRNVASAVGEFCIKDVDSCDSYLVSPLLDRDFDRKTSVFAAALRSGTGCPR